MLLQENTEPLTHATFTVNANTAYTTVKSVDLISNGGSITASADKEIIKPAEELPQSSTPPTTTTDNIIPTSSNTNTTASSDDSSSVASAKPQAKAPVIMYHSFSSDEPILSMTDSDSSNQLGLHTHHDGHLYRKHEMDSVTKKASSR